MARGYLAADSVDDHPDTAVSMKLIADLADLLPARQVLFLVDTCYSGIAGRRVSAVAAPSGASPPAQQRGRQVLMAGSADEMAIERRELGHGLFTYHLLQSLQGKADLNGDGVIPVSELCAFLDRRVFDTAQVHRREQRPALWRLGADAGELVFLVDQPVRLAKDSPGPAR